MVSKKASREQLKINKAKGALGQGYTRLQYELDGYHVERTGIGHDFLATRQIGRDGPAEKIYIETKTGPNAKLSPLQIKKKKELGKSYRVERF